MSCYYEFELCFLWDFSLTPLKKIGDFLSAFHAMKRWLLTNFLLFLWNCSFFSKSHRFFYFFIREHFSARKCSLCQTMACTDKKSHKQKLLLPSDDKFVKKERDSCLSFCFSNPQIFGNNKRASSVYFYWWQNFRQLSAMPLPCFVQQSFCWMTKRNWKFLQNFRQKFSQIVLVDT